MNRLTSTLQMLKQSGKKALTTFAMAGDPNQETSAAIFKQLAESADILEIGMPFSDPMADGPVIQAAGLRALEQQTTLDTVFEIVKEFRHENDRTPIILMGYINPVLSYGAEKFCLRCKDEGVDGLIIVDMPPEEGDELLPFAKTSDICMIRLVAPTTDGSRLETILENAGGFLYYVSIAGITGTASADPVSVGRHIEAIKQKTDMPVMAGFGIKTPADAAAMAAVSDGVVVGSGIVTLIEQHDGATAIVAAIAAYAQDLATAISSPKT